MRSKKWKMAAAGLVLAGASLMPVIASAHTSVYVGIGLGDLIGSLFTPAYGYYAPPAPVYEYQAPVPVVVNTYPSYAYAPPPVYYAPPPVTYYRPAPLWGRIGFQWGGHRGWAQHGGSGHWHR